MRTLIRLPFQVLNIAAGIFSLCGFPLFVWVFFNQQYLEQHRRVTQGQNETDAKKFLFYPIFLCLAAGLRFSSEYGILEYLTDIDEYNNSYKFVPLSGSYKLAFVIITDVVFSWGDLILVTSYLNVSSLISSLVQKLKVQNVKLINLMDSAEICIEERLHSWRRTYEGENQTLCLRDPHSFEAQRLPVRINT